LAATIHSMKKLEGKIAIVAGASRGAGRGISLALGDAGATVYVASRTSQSGPKPADGAPGTVEDTAEEVTARGGCGIAVRADLSDATQVAALFRRVEDEHGRLDVLANSAWAPNCMPFWGKPFWDLDFDVWRETLETVSVCWLTSVYAVRLMAKAGHGLIIHVTDNLGWLSDPSAHRGQILHDLGHECLNRLVMSTSQETKKLKIAVVGLNPGFMRTERVLMYMTTEARKKEQRFDLSESPEYIGRAVTALAADANVIEKTGQLLWTADLAKEYGLTDIDGRFIPRWDPNAPQQAFPC
jgi:NAD(P)-dependent dehydrogenase (short-subunit alcohol dehydrogenase family)